jgi:YebC/PmpR family DNA-binding regulatory protein
MSGHSHFATIKRQKAVNDAAKGRIFSRHAKAIAIAIKSGGSADPEMNSRLRFAVEQAKTDNMPKVNIDRILSRAAETGNIEEVAYEGYGPEGIALIVEAATDNKNRTAQEIKNIFERGGGSLAGPGAVSYNFEQKGLIVVKKLADVDDQMLSLIDLGAEDIQDSSDALEVYVSPATLSQTRDKILDAGFEIISFDLIRKPKNLLTVSDPVKVKKIVNFLESLEAHDDVQDVYSNFDAPESLLKEVS